MIGILSFVAAVTFFVFWQAARKYSKSLDIDLWAIRDRVRIIQAANEKLIQRLWDLSRSAQGKDVSKAEYHLDHTGMPVFK